MWLVAASLFFYAWWKLIYLPLLAGSILFNFMISNLIVKWRKSHVKWSRLLFFFGIFANVILLCTFKYFDFFIQNFNVIFQSNFELLHLLLPLGISFFTLQQIAYLVDSYDLIVKKTSFFDYCLFVSFFPQLIAGPIIHHKQILPQFARDDNKRLNASHIVKGIYIFCIGLAKKVIIADTLAAYANQGFDVASQLDFVSAWLVSFAYLFQLYFDFSGYMDMAIGAALFFNIRLPDNFKSPLRATSIINFWQRWHITLSDFITAYLYFPMVRLFKKITLTKAIFATVMAMTIAGFWHGAAWTFVIFGLYHGIGIGINQFWRKQVNIKIPRFLSWIITITFVDISFIFFRALSLSDAVKVVRGLTGLNGWGVLSSFANARSLFMEMDPAEVVFIMIILLLSAFIALFCKNSIEISEKFQPTFTSVTFACFLFVLSLIFLNKSEVEFIYFNF